MDVDVADGAAAAVWVREARFADEERESLPGRAPVVAPPPPPPPLALLLVVLVLRPADVASCFAAAVAPRFAPALRAWGFLEDDSAMSALEWRTSGTCTGPRSCDPDAGGPDEAGARCTRGGVGGVATGGSAAAAAPSLCRIPSGGDGVSVAGSSGLGPDTAATAAACCASFCCISISFRCAYAWRSCAARVVFNCGPAPARLQDGCFLARRWPRFFPLEREEAVPALPSPPTALVAVGGVTCCLLPGFAPPSASAGLGAAAGDATAAEDGTPGSASALPTRERAGTAGAATPVASLPRDARRDGDGGTVGADGGVAERLGRRLLPRDALLSVVPPPLPPPPPPPLPPPLSPPRAGDGFGSETLARRPKVEVTPAAGVGFGGWTCLVGRRDGCDLTRRCGDGGAFPAPIRRAVTGGVAKVAFDTPGGPLVGADPAPRGDGGVSGIPDGPPLPATAVRGLGMALRTRCRTATDRGALRGGVSRLWLPSLPPRCSLSLLSD